MRVSRRSNAKRASGTSRFHCLEYFISTNVLRKFAFSKFSDKARKMLPSLTNTKLNLFFSSPPMRRALFLAGGDFSAHSRVSLEITRSFSAPSEHKNQNRESNSVYN